MRQKQKLKAPSQSINESVVSTKNQSGQDLPQEKLLIKDKSGIGDDLRSYQDGLIDNLEESLLKAKAVSVLLNVSVKSVYLMAKQHRIRSVNFGRSIRFRKKDVIEFLERHGAF